MTLFFRVSPLHTLGHAFVYTHTARSCSVQRIQLVYIASTISFKRAETFFPEYFFEKLIQYLDEHLKITPKIIFLTSPPNMITITPAVLQAILYRTVANPYQLDSQAQ